MIRSSFIIPLPDGMRSPKPQPRPRARAMRMGDTIRATVYTPNDANLKRWREAIEQAIPDELRKAQHDGPVCLLIRMLYERPASHWNKSGLKASAPKAPIGADTGDFDNLAKPIADVMQNAGVYLNDSQITDPYGPFKRYAPRGMGGCVCVVVHLLDELPDDLEPPMCCAAAREGATQ